MTTHAPNTMHSKNILVQKAQIYCNCTIFTRLFKVTCTQLHLHNNAIFTQHNTTQHIKHKHTHACTHAAQHRSANRPVTTVIHTMSQHRKRRPSGMWNRLVEGRKCVVQSNKHSLYRWDNRDDNKNILGCMNAGLHW